MRITLAQMKNIGNMQDNLNKSIEQIREAAQYLSGRKRKSI